MTAWLQLLSVGLAGLIPLGSGAERWRLGAICASTALLAGWTYPLFAHWIWGGGWLAELGRNFGLGHGFVDVGGASSIHALGGLTALSMTWILGARRGKYTAAGMAAAVPAHNTVIVLLGCFLGWLGWIGLNSGGALVFAGCDVARVALVAINTTLGAASASMTAASLTRIRFGKSDASLSANGWFGGLVAVSGGCAFFTPVAAVAVGAIAGVLAVYAVGMFEFHLAVDDPTGAISVHAIGGIWGTLAVGLFAHFSAPAQGQFLAQAVGVATLLGVVLPLTYTLNWLLDRVYTQRVPAEGERLGMDLYELGAGAYPEFVSHTDEFIQH